MRPPGTVTNQNLTYVYHHISTGNLSSSSLCLLVRPSRKVQARGAGRLPRLQSPGRLQRGRVVRLGRLRRPVVPGRLRRRPREGAGDAARVPGGGQRVRDGDGRGPERRGGRGGPGGGERGAEGRRRVAGPALRAPLVRCPPPVPRRQERGWNAQGFGQAEGPGFCVEAEGDKTA